MTDRIRAKGIFKKTIAFDILNRDLKQVKAAKVADATAYSLHAEINKNIEEKPVLCTDEHKTYKHSTWLPTSNG